MTTNVDRWRALARSFHSALELDVALGGTLMPDAIRTAVQDGTVKQLGMWEPACLQVFAFLFEVWTGRHDESGVLPRFNLFEALREWDDEHLAAWQHWACGGRGGLPPGSLTTMPPERF